MATTAPPLICPQGHGPGVSGSRFCTLCGIQLVPAQAPAPAVSTVQQTPAWQPVVAPQVPIQAPTQQAAPPPPTPVPPAPAAQFSPVPLPSVTVQPVPMPAAAPAVIASAKVVCSACGGNGAGLGPDDNVCTQCGWLRPLLPGYQLDRSVFLWAQDGQAMANLQKIPAVNSAVRSASDKVGRPWIESTLQRNSPGPEAVARCVEARSPGCPHSWLAHHARHLCLGRFAVEHLHLRHRQQFFYRAWHGHAHQLPE